jgi:hypothetical protein
MCATSQSRVNLLPKFFLLFDFDPVFSDPHALALHIANKLRTRLVLLEKLLNVIRGPRTPIAGSKCIAELACLKLAS